LRKGLCPHACDALYSACRFDYFTSDPNNANQILPCGRNSLLCSQLKDITPKSHDFCRMLGHTINENIVPEDTWIIDIIKNNTFEPICFNLEASSEIWGRAGINEIPKKKKERNSGSLLKFSAMILVTMVSFMFISL
jgi:hypothetical protein